MTEVLKNNIEKNLSDSLERETLLNSSSSSTSFPIWKIKMEGLREEEIEQTGESLSHGLERIFGVSWNEPISIDIDKLILKKNKKLINHIMDIKVYSPKGFMKLYEEDLGISSKTLYKVQKILTKYDLLNITKWIGKARATFGLTLYFTNDASQIHFEKYLLDYIIQDELRYETQKIRDRKRSPEEIVDHNKQVRELSKLAKEKEPLNNQEKAKVILAAEEISIFSKDLEKERNVLKKHSNFCGTCEAAYFSGSENKCYEFHKIRQRFNKLSKTVVKTVAKNKDKIISQVKDIDKIKLFTNDITKVLTYNDKSIKQLEEKNSDN